MTRRTLAVFILAVWAGSLGWLAQREYLGTGPVDENPRWPVPPGAAFHAVRLGERQVGFSSFTVDTVAEGLRVIELITLDLPPTEPRTRRRVTRRTEALYTRGLQLRTWTADELGETGRRALKGVVQGDTALTVIASEAGTPVETLTVALRRPVVLPGAVGLVAAARGLPRQGDRLNVEIYDPFSAELGLERLVVARESLFVVPDSAEFNTTLGRWRVAHSDTVRAWRLDGDRYGLPVSRWIDGAGMTVRLVHPLGTVMERSAFELVSTNFRASPPPVWDTTGAAPDYFFFDGPPATVSPFGVVLALVPPAVLPESLPALDGGWQTRLGDTLVIAPPPPDFAGGPAPEDRAVPSGPMIDTALTAPALQAIPPAAPAEVAAKALEAWVRREIRPRAGPHTRGPTAVLASRTGTPREQVALLVALLRAADLPARRVWGVVRTGGRWQLRTWAEAWTGTWRPLDPTLAAGDPVARLRLATGGEARLLDLALRAGRLRFAALQETP
jgi:hypothetical protein